jgi:hypothetical protein
MGLIRPLFLRGELLLIWKIKKSLLLRRAVLCLCLKRELIGNGLTKGLLRNWTGILLFIRFLKFRMCWRLGLRPWAIMKFFVDFYHAFNENDRIYFLSSHM